MYHQTARVQCANTKSNKKQSYKKHKTSSDWTLKDKDELKYGIHIICAPFGFILLDICSTWNTKAFFYGQIALFMYSLLDHPIVPTTWKWVCDVAPNYLYIINIHSIALTNIPIVLRQPNSTLIYLPLSLFPVSAVMPTMTLLPCTVYTVKPTL